MKITSPAFAEGATIPDEYTLYGSNRIPPLHLDEVPQNARSLALIVEDPDAPDGTFNHWLLYNLDPKTRDIPEGTVPAMARQGRNDFGKIEYDGPKPPSGEHHYYFRAFALDTVLKIGPGAKRMEIDREMVGHVIDDASMMAKYERH